MLSYVKHQYQFPLELGTDARGQKWWAIRWSTRF